MATWVDAGSVAGRMTPHLSRRNWAAHSSMSSRCSRLPGVASDTRCSSPPGYAATPSAVDLPCSCCCSSSPFSVGFSIWLGFVASALSVEFPLPWCPGNLPLPASSVVLTNLRVSSMSTMLEFCHCVPVPESASSARLSMPVSIGVSSCRSKLLNRTPVAGSSSPGLGFCSSAVSIKALTLSTNTFMFNMKATQKVVRASPKERMPGLTTPSRCLL